jgi:hypothetical protein
MKCSKIRRLIADGGPAALSGNQKAEDHLVDCAECYAVLEAMAEVDRLLPELEQHDVADEVVETLLARPELETRPGIGAARPTSRFTRLQPLQWLGNAIDRARLARLRWGLVAVPAVLLIGLISITMMRSEDIPELPQTTSEVSQVKTKHSDSDVAEETTWEEKDRKERLSTQVAGIIGQTGADEAGTGRELGERKNLAIDSERLPSPTTRRVAIPDPTSDESEPLGGDPVELDDRVAAGYFHDDNLVLGAPDAPPPPTPESKIDVSLNLEDVDIGAVAEVPEFSNRTERPLVDRFDEDTLDDVRSANNDRTYERQQAQDSASNREVEEFQRKLDDLEAQATVLRDLGDDENAELLEKQHEELEKLLDGVEVVGGKVVSPPVSTPARSQPAEVNDDALAAAKRFLAEREHIEGLSFREARGYWANTYVPGDRTLRGLKARLDRAAGTGATGTLHRGSRQISQPFDPPNAAALAVYFHGDRHGVETRERMLVQVGLKGTLRRSGTRPAMNLGLVLDLRGEVTPSAATSMRALLKSLAASAELGDRFSVTVAGRPGGTILPPGDLRHGPLTVALAELFSEDASGPSLSLEQAAAAALATVRADDDPNAPLGSSALIIITAQRLGQSTGRLAAIAHRSAVDGVPWSVVGIGEGVDLVELDALVLAGQGNRRLLTSPADAELLVGRELAAVSRVVARAVRLRIRLAPGVQLVGVIGSERLGERRSQQVRDAEQSIDQRLSRNLGIQPDRGLDEEGIQIVIPSFYADNAHVVLLDVVVPGPGPVADVTVRYKDLVHMKNGVARAHLRVGRLERPAGPLERNVLANLVATEVASRLDHAADSVAAGDVAAARATLIGTLNLVRGITILVDGLANHPDLQADIEMLEGFIEALTVLPADDSAQLQTAADSLRYAGRLKILPPPAGEDEETP